MCTSRIETFTVNEHGSTGVVLACTTIGDTGRGTTLSSGDADRHHWDWTSFGPDLATRQRPRGLP